MKPTAERHQLQVSDLHAFYGESHILHGIDFTVRRGECVSLLGRNGAGRTTTLRALMGLTGKRTGSIMINGREAIAMPPHKIAQLGVRYCPEEQPIHHDLILVGNRGDLLGQCEDHVVILDRQELGSTSREPLGFSK